MTPNTSERKKKKRRDSEDYVEVLTSEERKTLLHVSGHSSLQSAAHGSMPHRSRPQDSSIAVNTCQILATHGLLLFCRTCSTTSTAGATASSILSVLFSISAFASASASLSLSLLASLPLPTHS